MHVIGEDTSERLDVIPAQYRVIVTHRPRLACRACERIVEAPAPQHLIKSGLPTEAMVASVLVGKYGWHLPLTIIACDRPEVTGLGLTAPGIEHWHRRLIDSAFDGGEQFGLEPFVQRHQLGRRIADPERQRRAVEIEPLCGQHFGLAVVGPICVVVADPTTDPCSCLTAGFEGIEVDAFVFQRSPQPFDEDVIHPAATTIHRDADVGILQDVGEGKAGELRALIVLKISGLPKRAIASCSAVTQKSASMVFDNLHARTFRLNQSMITTRYRKPLRIGM